MIVPAEFEMIANRHTPFVLGILFEQINFTGAILDMQIRQLPDSPGAPLVDLSPAAPGAQGLSVAYSAPDSLVQIWIDESTIETLPAANEAGENATLWYDLHITPSGQPKQVYFRGPFTIRAGVTDS